MKKCIDQHHCHDDDDDDHHHHRHRHRHRHHQLAHYLKKSRRVSGNISLNVRNEAVELLQGTLLEA
jgi:hypothetical protein